ncbi:MAG: thioredoxin family protein [Candidatus Lokiarchaeota archaeon]|nr:thioredoxin family protein [Candidatus Lokiarchaeota archaeon]
MNIKDLEKYGIEGPDKGKLIIDLSSNWCGPCKLLSPVLEKIRDSGLIDLIQINIDENRELGQKLKIYAVPTLLFFKDGQLLDKDIKVEGETMVNNGVMVGATGEIILKEIIKQM